MTDEPGLEYDAYKMVEDVRNLALVQDYDDFASIYSNFYEAWGLMSTRMALHLHEKVNRWPRTS